MPSYYTIPTTIGAAKIANAIALGTQINVTKLAIGDGGGTLPIPDSDRASLVNEVRRSAVNRIEIDADNPNWVVVEQVLPPDVGGWTIREIGLFDDAGDLIAYGNYPETYKPVLSEGSGRTQTIRFILQVSDAAAVTLQVDPSVVLATREWAENQANEKVLAHDKDPAAHMTSSLTGSGMLMARMRAGLGMRIAFYGDSTTDGLGTTGWTKNPVDAAFNAIGTTDHGGNGGYNAYPRRLQDLLREFYGNSGIYCYNAGYSGKRADNGWAYDNLDAAVLESPVYGDCEVVVLAFGLNDAAQDGSRMVAYASETEKMIRKILASGRMPVLMSADAHWRSHDEFDDSGTSYENTEITEINAAKRGLAQRYGIPYLEMHDNMRDWMNRNGGRTWWRKVSPDGLHSNDEGHQIKAAILAEQLISEMYRVSRHAVERIEWHDARCHYPYDHGSDYGLVVEHSAIQNNFQVGPGEFTPAAALLDAWVWCDEGNMPLLYRMISDAGQGSSLELSELGRIKIYHLGADPATPIYDEVVNGAGITAYLHHGFDRPCRLLRLPYGLNRIVMEAPTRNDLGRNLFGGYFEVNSGYSMAEARPFLLGDQASLGVLKTPVWTQNLLARTGALKYTVTPQADGERYVFAQREERDGSNSVSFGVPGQHVEIYLRAALLDNCGVVLFAGPSHRPSGDIVTSECSYFVYRPSNSSDAVRIYIFGDEGGLRLLGEGTLSGGYPSDQLECTVVFKRAATGEQLITLHEGKDALAAPVLSFDSSVEGYAGPFAGTMGGVYVHGAPSLVGTDVTLEIHEMIARHY